MAVYTLGKVLPLFRGTWSRSYNYFTMDIVYHDGSSYVAKSDILAGQADPSVNSDWQIIAMKGELSGTLTPEQEQAIIDAIMAQGVVIDSNYNHTDNNFSDADRIAVEGINYGTLTINRNNTPIGTFTANTNSTVNIAVPVNSWDLNDGNDIVKRQTIITSLDTSITLEVKANHVYVFDSVQTIDIINFEDIDITDKTTWNVQPTYIYFTALDGFGLTVPSGTLFTTPNPTYSGGTQYRITAIGGVLTVEELFI